MRHVARPDSARCLPFGMRFKFCTRFSVLRSASAQNTATLYRLLKRDTLALDGLDTKLVDLAVGQNILQAANCYKSKLA